MDIHTPGPWELSDDFQIGIPLEDASGENAWIDLEIAYDIFPVENLEANARLIAAAPELLAALEAIDRGLQEGRIKFTKKRQSDSDPYHSENMLMTSAIRKARGQ